MLRLHTIGSRAPSRCLSFCSVLAWLLGESGRCVRLPESLLLLYCCVFPRDVLYSLGLLRGFPCLCFCGFLALGVLNWSTAQVTLFCVISLRLVALIGLLRE